MSDKKASSQSFEELRAKCLSEKRLFEDPLFPAEPKSIDATDPSVSDDIVWKRPTDLSKNPQFSIEGLSRFDLDQGSLENCWFIAAAATLATKPELLEMVVPPNQSFTEKYAGIFHFRFWSYGKWTDVVIDDRLPCSKKNKRLVYCRNKEQPDEFWSALLEKAYAKHNGSYAALRGGTIQDALVDFTGGVSETIELSDKSKTNEELFATMKRLEKANSLMGCAILVFGESRPTTTGPGLLTSHAYSITGLETVTAGNKTINMIRLLNPWGKAEWTGPWSDSSAEWNSVSEATKKTLQFRNLEDGEFWMSFDDWRKYFTQLQLCHLTSQGFHDCRNDSHAHQTKMKWDELSAHGNWVKGATAGGSGVPDIKFYWQNPQYCIIVNKEAKEKAESSSASLVVSLMQKERREATTSSSSSSDASLFRFFTIGYRLFKITINQPITIDNSIYPSKTTLVEDGSHRYMKYREVACHYDNIEPGVYCVIPTTWERNEEGSFLLRVLTHLNAELRVTNGSEFGDTQYAGIPLSGKSFIGDYVTRESIPTSAAEPMIKPVRAPNLLLSRIAPPSMDADLTDGDEDEQDMTPADRDILEIYEKHAGHGHFSLSNANVLRHVLSELNEIGQLGCYKINFSETESRVLFRTMSSNRRNMTFGDVRRVVRLIKQWVNEFFKHDRNSTAFVTFRQLWEILSSLGFPLNAETKEIVTTSYGSHQRGVSVSEFVRCVAKIYSTAAYWTTKSIGDSCNIYFEELLQVVFLT